MGRNFYLALFPLCAAISAQAVSLGKQCTSDGDCSDPNSACKPHRCDLYTCQCDVGYTTDPRLNKCVKASLIGKSCNSSLQCVPRHSECNKTDQCQCRTGYRSTQHGFWCLDTNHKALGEACTNKTECGLGGDCVSGNCTCDRDHAPWGPEERWFGLPGSKYSQCEKLDAALSVCNGSTYPSPVPTTPTKPTVLTTEAPPPVPLGQKCTSHSKCVDGNALCRPHRCDYDVCQCNKGYTINGQSDTCEKASLIGESCNSSLPCVPRHSECNKTDQCQCRTGYRATQDGFWCLDAKHKALGEACTQKNECGLGGDCVRGNCTCDHDHAPWGPEERWFGLPGSKYSQCENLNYTLNKCHGVTFEPPFQ